MRRLIIKQFNLLFAILVTSVAMGQITEIVTHDFDDGNLAPFEACNLKSPSYVAVENGRVTTFWVETDFDGTRNDRGVEFCGHELGDWLTYKEGWCGVKVELGSDYPKNKTAGIAQIMGRRIDILNSTWAGEISIANGDLKVEYRLGNGSSNTITKIIYPDFPYEEEVDMIIHFILSGQGNGELEFWINGVSVYRATNISLGYGEFNENDEQIPGLSRSIFKLGQYNYDSDNYDQDETRTVYYDNVTWYNGSNGYEVVDPSDGSNVCSKIITDQQINSESFCENEGTTVNDATEGGSYMGGIQAGDYLSYGVFDFDVNSIDAIEVAVGKSSTKDTYIEVRLDDPTGTLIGTVDVSETTGGSQVWATEWVNLDPTSGKHEVFLVFDGETNVTLVNFNWFKLFELDVCFINAEERPEHIEAECFDDMFGIQTQASSEGTDNVGWIENGDWLMYRDIDLTGMNSVKGRLSGSTTGSIIEVRLDGLDGELIAEIPVSNTDGNQNWVTDNVNIINTSGVHEVYLVFTGADGFLFNINHFGFSEEEIVVTNTNKILNLNTTVFPNPATSFLNINNQSGAIVKVFNTTGSIELSQMVLSDHQLINIEKLSKGMYYIVVSNGNRTGKKLFIKN